MINSTNINNEFDDHIDVAKLVKNELSDLVLKAGFECLKCIKGGGKIILFGNGGSASDAQHIAAEFVGRYVRERKGLPAISLATDTSALTAIGNDYGFDRIFDRQIEALGHSRDVAIAISTSGNSSNVIKGVNAAKSIGMPVIGLSGRDGGDLNKVCDISLVVPSQITARIQEMHILIGHIFCQIVDDGIAD